MSSERRLLIEALPSYDVGEEIGRGGWGVVYSASHRSLKRQVAVKSLPRAFGADPAVRARFLAEAQVVAALDHPHIVPLYDFVEHEGLCLLVMELMPGGTLWDRFSASELGPEQACAVTVAMLTGLDHAHNRDILHRDVKPENVLFNASGVPKLADFGIAKVIGDSSSQRTATGVVMGTPAYMAPEQGSGQPVSAATDVYAVGAMLYELLAGRLPFESTGDALSQLYRHVHERPRPVREIAASVPAPVASVVMHALEKDPGDRFESAVAFARALDAAATEGYGRDWLERSEIQVLAPRSTLATGGDAPASRTNATVVLQVPDREAPSTPPPAPARSTTPPSTAPPPAPVVPVPDPVQGRAPQQPAPQQPAPQPAPAAAALPASSPTPTPGGETMSEPSGRSTGLVVAVVIVVLVLAAGAAVALISRGEDAPSDQAEPAEVPVELTRRFESNCVGGGVDPELCRCALDTALDEMTASEFATAEQVLNTDGEGLTAELETIFERCQAPPGSEG